MNQYHQYQNPFTVENAEIMFLFAEKMVSIWWPVLLASVVMGYFLYRQEQKQYSRVAAQRGRANRPPEAGRFRPPGRPQK